MPAPLTVVIPTLNAEKSLPGCFAALIDGVEADLIREVIVVDGGSGDQSVQVAEAAGAEVIVVSPSRGGQLRGGADAARGDWMLFLHADTQLAPGWAKAASEHLASGKPACFQHRFDRGGLAAHLVSNWANLRTRIFGLPYGDQALLIARANYDRSGGYRDMPLMEDVDLARRLGPVSVLPVAAITSAAKYRAHGWLRVGARNLWFLLRFLGGADPEKLAARYRALSDSD